MKKHTMCLIMSLVFAGGCATVTSDAGFDGVQRKVEERLGHRVQWRQGATADSKADRAVNDLLANELTADEAVQVALLNNRRLQATYEDLGVAQAAVVQAGLLRNPVFSFGAGFPIEGGQVELSMSVAQDFLDVLLVPLRKSVARAEFEAARLQVSSNVIGLAARTRAAFYRVVADEQLLEMRQQVAAATSASYEVAKRLHKAGNIRELDLHNEKLIFDQARLDMALAQAATIESRERLNRLMGVWGEQTQWTNAHRLPGLPEAPPSLDDLESKAIENSFDLAAARQQIVAYANRLGSDRATAAISFLEMGPEAEREEGEWEVGPHVSVPIPIFDQGQARIAAAEAELRRRQQLYTAMAVDIRSAVRAARQRVLTAHRVAMFYRDEVLPLRDQITRQTLLQYNAMQAGVFQLLSARQQQISAGQRYIESLYNYWAAQTELDTILQGRLPDLQQTTPIMMTTSPALPGGVNETGGH